MSKKIEEMIKVDTSRMMGNFVFEMNNIESRKFITTHIDKFLKSLDINDYEIVCNDTNNPAKMIDENKLLVEIYIQYQDGDEYKKYAFVMSRNGADFSELLNQVEDVNE